MTESEYVLACNIKSCREIKSQIDEMVIDCGDMEAKLNAARHNVDAVERELMGKLVIDDKIVTEEDQKMLLEVHEAARDYIFATLIPEFAALAGVSVEERKAILVSAVDAYWKVRVKGKG